MLSICKSDLKYFPIIGWGAYFCEHIFVNRKWETDKELMEKGLENCLLDYSKDINFKVISVNTSKKLIFFKLT